MTTPPQCSISPSHVAVGSQQFTRRDDDTLFRAMRGVAGVYSRAFHQVRLASPCQVPPRGPAILICNHVSSIDPVILQAFCPRLVRWLMAKEYYEFKSMRWLFNTLGVILVERTGQDLVSARAAMRALAAGYVIGIFPEGRIETTKELLPFQSGIGLLALRTRAPVFPVYLDGTQRGKEMVQAAITRSDIVLSFGPRVRLEDLRKSRHGVHEATRRIELAVRALQNAKA